MMRIAILWDVRHALIDRIGMTLLSLGATVRWVRWTDLNFRTGDSTILSSIDDCDGAYLDRLGESTRGYAAHLALLDRWRMGRKVVVNSPCAYWVGMDKTLTFAHLAKSRLPYPRTGIVCSLTALEAFCSSCIDSCVIKSSLGTCAEEIVAFRASQVPVDIARRWLDRDGIILVQEYIRFGGRYIWRVDVVNGCVIVANKRHAFNPNAEHSLCNGSRGGKIEFFKPNELPAQVRDLALATAASFGLEVVGVDLLPEDHGGLMVCEVNPEPDITLDRMEFPDAIARHLFDRVLEERAGSSGGAS